ncbi:MAG: UDP-N-acetylglucosamine 2-epimerase [Bacteroidota bacterium]|nr:UDP-N-acetylglucosamine 2-epimerase [Bacteroidota bacterium]
MKKIIFLTGTRADFGKLKSLIEITLKSNLFEVFIFATGMHMSKKYGNTVEEIEKCGYKNIYKYINHTSESSMDQTLAKTIEGLSNFSRETNPDLIIIHGDRVEALAGAIVGSLNNILVAHIEGGEVSGTIDELIRHAVSKLSHVHFVSNKGAKKRLIQMGEMAENIFVIGSPDVDVMLSDTLPSIQKVRERYEIPFEDFGLILFHPVTTEIGQMSTYAKQFVDAIIETESNYIVIYPNNDLGSNLILAEYERFNNRANFKIYPSVRFEYFLVMLRHSKFLVGNSSAGIREAPYYGLPAVNIGTRQQNRSLHDDIINCGYTTSEITEAIKLAQKATFPRASLFGNGKSDELFSEVIRKDNFWEINKQKVFKDFK